MVILSLPIYLISNWPPSCLLQPCPTTRSTINTVLFAGAGHYEPWSLKSTLKYGGGAGLGEISAQNIDSLLQHELFYLYWNKVSHPLLIDIECGLIISFDYLWTEMINDKAKEDWIHFCSDLHFVAFCTINILWTFLSPSLGKYCVDKSSAYCFSMIVLAGLSCTLITSQNDIF